MHFARLPIGDCAASRAVTILLTYMAATPFLNDGTGSVEVVSSIFRNGIFGRVSRWVAKPFHGRVSVCVRYRCAVEDLPEPLRLPWHCQETRREAFRNGAVKMPNRSHSVREIEAIFQHEIELACSPLGT